MTRRAALKTSAGHWRQRSALAAAALLALSCSGMPEVEDLAAHGQQIVGGAATPTCSWPTTAHVVTRSGGGCSATLVHPRLITIAAHCVDDGAPEEIFLGDTSDHDGPGRSVPVESCRAKGGPEVGEDFAYCMLAEPVTDVSIIPILYGCELELLQAGARALLVGFGYIDEDTPPPNGHKRWVEAPIAKVKEKTIDVGDPGHSNCFGDSGGPAYLQLPDGSWRVFGVTSTTYEDDGVPCLREGTWALTPYFVPWLEEDSGLDVTPCFDADGSWHPSDACRGVPLNPGESTGTWSQMCREAESLSGPLSTCGRAVVPGGGLVVPPDTSPIGGSGGSGSGGQSAAGAPAGGALTEGASGASGIASGSSSGSDAGGTTTVPPLAVSTSSPGEVVGNCSCRAAGGRASARGLAACLGLALVLVSRRLRKTHGDQGNR